MQHFTIAKDATSQILPISVFDSSSTTGAKLAGLVYNSAGMTAYYNRSGAAGAATVITLVTATKGTFASSGFIAIDGTNMPGDYELHIPNAAIATGADTVLIQIKGATNQVPLNIKIDLVDEIDLGTDNRVLVSADAHTSGQTIAGTTGDTKQTADHTAAIADIPTVAEFNARTLVAASYFDPATDPVANVTLCATTTALTNVINASSIIASVSGNVDGSVGSVTGGATAAAQTTAQNDLDIITGADGVNLLTATQASIDAIEADTNSLNDTKIPNTLNTTALGNIGIDWANVENPTTALDLSATDIQLVDTVTTYTGNTLQTGDSFARLGAPTGASIAADLVVIDNFVDGIETAVITNAAGVDISADIAAVKVDTAAILVDTSTTLPGIIDDLAIKKNATFSNFEFLMVLTSDHATPATGLTVTGERSIDGAAFAAVGGTIAEVSNGIYQFDALAADTNGDVITWRFSSATADDAFVTFKTVA